ncbi:MAG TPA: hypothetical protein VN638_06190, partial [Nitrospiraceae bacterium]|nr:hypothetical protein [Nitrospiraceae bacterium]
MFSLADQGFAEVSVAASPEEGSAQVQGPAPAGEPRQRWDQSPDSSGTGSKQESVLLNWETGEGRSYLIPSVELLSYLFLLNQYDRHFTEPKDVYRTTGDTFWQHLTDSKWVLDNDRFSVNQFLHPYGGSVY